MSSPSPFDLRAGLLASKKLHDEKLAREKKEQEDLQNALAASVDTKRRDDAIEKALNEMGINDPGERKRTREALIQSLEDSERPVAAAGQRSSAAEQDRKLARDLGRQAFIEELNRRAAKEGRGPFGLDSFSEDELNEGVRLVQEDMEVTSAASETIYKAVRQRAGRPVDRDLFNRALGIVVAAFKDRNPGHGGPGF